jgi:hypothetical protein
MIHDIDSNLLTVLQGIADKSLDSVKFSFTAGMFGTMTNEDASSENNPYKAMCYMAVHCECPDILKFLLEEVVFKSNRADDLLFQCMQAVVEQNNPALDKVMLDCTLATLPNRSDKDTFAARVMREVVQEACIHENWNICREIWTRRDEFPITVQYDEKTKMNIGKDKEFVPAFITGAVFHDNLEAIEMAVNLPDRWNEYTEQCLPTWFRMALEGHSRRVARYLLPLVKDYIMTNNDYATCVVKDTLRTGAIELYVQICQMLLEKEKVTP